MNLAKLLMASILTGFLTMPTLAQDGGDGDWGGDDATMAPAPDEGEGQAEQKPPEEAKPEKKMKKEKKQMAKKKKKAKKAKRAKKSNVSENHAG